LQINYRARKCYEKVGFVKYKESYDRYEEQEYLLVDDEYKKFNEMIYKDGVIYTKYHYMMSYNEL
jgi:ribosomal protein S18 acetylase RimI-like enzyme